MVISISDIVVQNPVLYFFLCDDEQIPTIIANEQKKHFDTIKYIIIDETVSEILEFIDAVHESFIKHEYRTSGEIRVNCFYSYKKSSHLLFGVLNQIEASMSDFYPGGVVTDVYVYFDELDKTSRTQLGRILHELAKLKNEVNMIYLFSCINSKGLLIKENPGNIYKTISSLFFIKDTMAPGQDDCIFDERYFCADAMAGKGDFFTAGYANLSVPVYEIENIITTRVVDEIIDKAVSPDVIWSGIYVKPKTLPYESIDNLRYIAIAGDFELSKAKRLTNRETIESAFRNRLYMYFDMNLEPENQVVQPTDISLMMKNLVTRDRLNIFEIYNSIKKGTPFDLFFSDKLAAAGKNAGTAEADLDNWLDSAVDSSVLQNKSGGIFQIAKIYTDLRIEILNRRFEYDTLKSLKSEFDIFNAKAEQFYNSVLVEYEQSKKLTQISLNKLPSIMTMSIVEYYNDIAEKFLRSNMQSLNNYLTGFSELTGNYYEFIKSFCIENIAGFLKNTTIDKEIMTRFKFSGMTNESLAMILLDSVISLKVYNLNIKSEDKNNRVEITLILNSNSLLAKYIPICSERSGRYKISMTFEDDKKDIDIIYQMGAFQMDELYYAEFMNERQI